jgi:D-alanyl-D-alanine dipeptidase
MNFADRQTRATLLAGHSRGFPMALACLLLIAFACDGRASDNSGDNSGDSAVQATIGTVQTFHIEPVRPIAELEHEALLAQPPREAGEFLQPDLVDLTTIDPVLRLDIRYATDNNFLGVPVYRQARAFLQRPAAEALVRAHQRLQAEGYGLLIHDAYRPWYVTRIFWDATPEQQKIFVANPADGSRHNRGCAVDLTLYEIATGQPVEMPSGYDELTERAYPDYAGGTAQQRQLRDLLRASMEAEGFTVYPEEWWHYDYQDWRRYPILNKTFEEIEP